MSGLRDISNPFWMSIKSNFSLGESIEEVLKSPNWTIEKLLEDDSFAQECRSGNARLISFLSKKKNLKGLLKYIIEDPSEGVSHKRGHKYPFMVSDILWNDPSALLDVFFTEEVESNEELDEEGEDGEHDKINDSLDNNIAKDSDDNDEVEDVQDLPIQTKTLLQPTISSDLLTPEELDSGYYNLKKNVEGKDEKKFWVRLQNEIIWQNQKIKDWLLQANGYKLSVEVQVNEEFFSKGYSKDDVYKLEEEDQIEESKMENVDTHIEESKQEIVEPHIEQEESKQGDADEKQETVEISKEETKDKTDDKVEEASTTNEEKINETSVPSEEKIEEVSTSNEESKIESTTETLETTPEQPAEVQKTEENKQTVEPIKTDEPKQTIEQELEKPEEVKVEEQKIDSESEVVEESSSNDKVMKDNNSNLNQDPSDEEHKVIEEPQNTDEEKENKPIADSEPQKIKEESNEKVVVEVSEDLKQAPEQTVADEKQIVSEDIADTKQVLEQNEQLEEIKDEKEEKPVIESQNVDSETHNDKDNNNNVELEEKKEIVADEEQEDSTDEEQQPTKNLKHKNADTQRMKELLFGKPKSDKNDNEIDPDAGKHIIDILFDFLRVETELNPVLCGYFCKFMNTLMNHNRKGFFSYIFESDHKVVEYLIKHIYNRSIADILVKVLCDYSEITVDKKQFILQIIDNVESQVYEGKLNSSMVLVDIMEFKSWMQFYKTLQLNQRLFDLIKSDDGLTVRVGLTVLNVLYKKFPFYIPKPVEEVEDNFAKVYLPSSTNGEEMHINPEIDELLKEELPFIENVLDQKLSNTLAQQYGEIIIPFGATKLQAVKFVSSIIALGNQEYALILATCLPTLLKYCRGYPWNSFLHNNVENIFYEIFKKNSKYSDDVRTALIAESELTDYISECQVEAVMRDSGRKIRSGLPATINSIANMLFSHTSEYVQEELTKSDKWSEYVEIELLPSNDNNDRALAGHSSKAGDSDDDSANYETSMDKLFAVFTNLKESHDSSRELDDSDSDEEPLNTDNILKDINTSSESLSSAESDSKKKDPKKKTRNSASEEVKNDKTPEPQVKVEDKIVKPVAIKQLEPEEKIEEVSSFHDNSYWAVPSSFSLDKLLQDA